MSVETKVMTADELLAMPDDGAHRYELVDGELITMSPAGWDHGVIGGRIAASLIPYGIVPTSDTGYLVSRDPDTVLQPDVSLVLRPRNLQTKRFFPGAPDLAVEVISPTDSYSDVRAKVRRYLRGGVGMVILIDPDARTAEVSTSDRTIELTVDDTLTGGDVIPGWSLPMRELFD